MNRSERRLVFTDGPQWFGIIKKERTTQVVVSGNTAIENIPTAELNFTMTHENLCDIRDFIDELILEIASDAKEKARR